MGFFLASSTSPPKEGTVGWVAKSRDIYVFVFMNLPTKRGLRGETELERLRLLLAGQLVVAQAASRGRIEVGLGAGSFHLARHDHLAVSIPFPPFGRRVELLAHCCDVLPRLFRGQRVSDPMLGFVDASLGPVDVPVPPIYVGGSSDRVLRVAAAHADGWNVVVSDAKRFAELSARVDALCRQLDRSRPLVKAAQVFVRDVGFSKARRLLDELDRAGADAATFVLVDEKGPRAVEQLAATVLR